MDHGEKKRNNISSSNEEKKEEAHEVTVGDKSKKQGAYGKVIIHKESKLSQLMRIDEVWAAISLLYIKPMESNLKSAEIEARFNAQDLNFCDEILGKVSRSFAAVIRQLPQKLLVDVMVFYLVLRALDTIEDDMTAFSSHKEKTEILLNFHKTALVYATWSMDGVGQGDEKRLLQNFSKCHSVYKALPETSQRIIKDITHRMATGMAEFVTKDLGQGTINLNQYNRYCHFVAGLVGEGLSRLFASSNLEHASLANHLHLADQMGLFLQKTNIIRDYKEDLVDQRAFWPQSVWNLYSPTHDLDYFANHPTQPSSLNCLNHLITDALSLAPDCLTYLSKLSNPQIFRFCAIPQVMAIATLHKCYHNSDIFTGVVKIRKGLSCKLIQSTNNIQQVHCIFYRYATAIAKKANAAKKQGFVDPNYDETVHICDSICQITRPTVVSSSSKLYNTTLLAFCGGSYLAMRLDYLSSRNASLCFTSIFVAFLVPTLGISK